MPLWDIVGYSYKADTYCPSCVLYKVKFDNGWEEYTNIYLEEVAERLDIDWQDESSFDSGDFPKVIFRDMIEEEEYCSSCHEELS